ncbi:uncharacterized protein LOC143255897 [Tachypleus tridentatus]|uniref:uncharacterized protein LOC143255897 n=1 Tax=Tachypleus tridentatus TaxID=6853 RepID=UPI003FD607EE
MWKRQMIRLDFGRPWGFRLSGGVGTGRPIVVYKIRRKSKSHNVLLEGDVVESINGYVTKGLTHEQTMDIVDKASNILVLKVSRWEENQNNALPQVTGIALSSEKVTMTETEEETFEEHIARRDTNNISLAFQLQEEKPGALCLPTVNVSILGSKDAMKITPASSDLTPVEQDSKLTHPEEEPLTHARGISEGLSSKNERLKKKAQGFDENLRERVTSNILQKQSSRAWECYKLDSNHPPHVTPIRLTFSGNSEPGDRVDLTSLSAIIPETTDNSLAPTGQTTAILAPMFKVRKIDTKTTKDADEYVWKPPGFNSLPRPKDVPSFSQKFLSTLFSTATTTVTTTTTTTALTSNVTTAPKQELKKTVHSDLGSTDQQENLEIRINPHAYEPAPEAEMDYFEIIPRKKKMFSSSSFYEEPNAIYPTVEEQVKLCRKIAGSLSSETNRKSRGANMFFKRVKRSQKWVHEGPDPDGEAGRKRENGTTELSTSDFMNAPYIKVGKDPPKLKLILDPRYIQDAVRLRKEGKNISEHNVVSPDVCLGIVKDLYGTVGKGAAMFAKRKKKSEEWVVDEGKIKALLSKKEYETALPVDQKKTNRPSLATPTPPSRLQEMTKRTRFKLVKSPWEAALESPFGSCDAAFVEVKPHEELNSIAESIIRAAETKTTTLTTPSVQIEKDGKPATSEPLPTPSVRLLQTKNYDLYRPRAPRGWTGYSTASSNLHCAQDPVPSVPQETHQEFTFSKIQKKDFKNFNRTPKSWSLTTSEESVAPFKPVKYSLGHCI